MSGSSSLPTPAPGAPHLALRVIVMPKDANPYGSIFGGVILSYIDQAAFVQARTHAQCRWVTLAMDRVEFKQPVFVGDTLNLYARTVKTGRSSVTVEIDVRAERFAPGPDGRHGPTVPVTSATLVMVAVDSGGKSVPFAEAGRSASAGESQW